LLLMTCLQELFFRLVSSDAVLSDAFFQTLLASNKIPLLLNLFDQNLYE